MGYLDSAGLAHVWGKVKTALAGKQNTITAGDGLTKEGDTLSVAAPVRSIVTQAEFDALPEAQRSKGLYVISGGGGSPGGESESAGEVYSTEETRIGTWFGKPLYRRVIVTETPSAINTETKVADCSNFNVDKMCNFYGFYRPPAGSQLRDSETAVNMIYKNVGSSSALFYNYDEQAFAMLVTNNGYTKNSLYITTEYTKTSDPEVSE